MEKEMKIIPPEGYEVDEKNSTFECIKFKPIDYPVKEKEEAFVGGASSILRPYNSIRDSEVDRYAEVMSALCAILS